MYYIYRIIHTYAYNKYIVIPLIILMDNTLFFMGTSYLCFQQVTYHTRVWTKTLNYELYGYKIQGW